MLLTRRITWHMAHRIYGYDGLCGTLHGHTYSAEISLEGPVHDQSGMVCDFGDLKKILANVIDGWFDHSVFLWEGDPLVSAVRPYSTRMVVLSGAATAENLGRVLFGILDKKACLISQGGVVEKCRLARTSRECLALGSLSSGRCPRAFDGSARVLGGDCRCQGAP